MLSDIHTKPLHRLLNIAELHLPFSVSQECVETHRYESDGLSDDDAPPERTHRHGNLIPELPVRSKTVEDLEPEVDPTDGSKAESEKEKDWIVVKSRKQQQRKKAGGSKGRKLILLNKSRWINVLLSHTVLRLVLGVSLSLHEPAVLVLIQQCVVMWFGRLSTVQEIYQ